MHHILVYEPDQSRVPHLVFLLNLADIHCTVARSTEELLNWLSAVHLEVTHFDLLLLHSWQRDELGQAILKRIIPSASLPVLYVTTEEISPADPALNELMTCTPDNLLSCLDDQLNRIDLPTTKEA